MRTTLTLDDVVNDALRCGLQARNAARRPFRIEPWDGGEILIPVVNVAEALAQAEGDDFKPTSPC